MKIFNNQGFSSLAAAGLMAVLSIFGFSVISLVSTSKAAQTDQLFYDRTFYVVQAGLEYGMRKIYEGLSPVVSEPGITFGGGSFIIGRVDRLVTVTARHSGFQVVHSVTSPSQADCTEFDTNNVNLSEDGKKLSQIQFEKICLEQTILDKITISWTNPGSEGMNKIRVESQTLYENPDVASGVMTELADYVMTGNNNNNMNEVKFSHDMSGKTFTFNFIMGDGSAESYTFTPDDD